jgi:hypothetical protein
VWVRERELMRAEGTVFVWTKQDDKYLRFVFDGDRVESIAVVDPDGGAEFIAEFTINGLKEIAVALPPQPDKPVVVSEETVQDAMAEYARIAEKMKDISVPKPSTQLVQKRKYPKTVAVQFSKKFAQLDDKHPFFGMVKFGDEQK